MNRIELLRPFKDIMVKVPPFEMHVHTNQTDGKASVIEIMESAIANGITVVVFTEHVRNDSKWFNLFAEHLRVEASRYPELSVVIGCEAKVLDLKGTLDLSEEILHNSDFVLGSVHRFPKVGEIQPYISGLSYIKAAETECDLALGILENKNVDVLAHPGGMALRQHGHFPPHLFEKIIRKAVERKKAVEINSSYLNDENELKAFLKLCDKFNPMVTIGSDVHRQEEVGYCFRMLKKIFKDF